MRFHAPQLRKAAIAAWSRASLSGCSERFREHRRVEVEHAAEGVEDGAAGATALPKSPDTNERSPRMKSKPSPEMRGLSWGLSWVGAHDTFGAELALRADRVVLAAAAREARGLNARGVAMMSWEVGGRRIALKNEPGGGWGATVKVERARRSC